MRTRIVITGMGAVCPIGNDVTEAWSNAKMGVSGVGPITQFDSSEFQVHIAAEVKNLQFEDFLPTKEIRRRDRFENFAAVAAGQAIRQARLVDDSSSVRNPERIGVIVSSAIGGLTSLHQLIYTVKEEGPRKLSPFGISMLMPNGAAGMISIDYGFQGPSFSVASACASGSDGIGIAWSLLQAGVIDVAVTGGCEATITPVGIGTFDRIGAMSRKGGMGDSGSYDTPKPFDLERDGLVMGEGAGILILEREEHAKERKADILAELAGYSATADAYHITAPSTDGSGGARCILQALAKAEVGPEEVGYINAHGTATQLNDLSETRAIKAAFKEQAYNIPVSSTKSMTGHMMGATGALEAIFCVQALREGILPPTIHYTTADPDCDLDYIPNQAREREVQAAISNAFGFGGHNSVLVFRKYPS